MLHAPYPSSPEAVAPLVAVLTDAGSRQRMLGYGQARWNAAKLEAEIAKGAAWARKHGVHLTCNEFGVYRVAPPADRNRCIADTRRALEKYDIGWCMWDYATDFGVATGDPGHRVPDPATLRALGLPPPTQF